MVVSYSEVIEISEDYEFCVVDIRKLLSITKFLNEILSN